MSAPDGFTCTTEHHVPGLELTLRSYSHPSGARHLHLDCDDPHRAFAVAFRTAPEDDTGLPHILEHLSLCGSRRYPVRDPFFMMLRRSLQTFMNAFTYPDMTCYPFATLVPKDFDNLLSIYLDAVFAPRLDPLDFAQEGWRLEPADARAPTDDWALRGVVFNEMKGSMGNTDARLFDALGRELLGATCYRFNSGGDPEAIPTLAHADLVDYHRRHYGAANACFTTYGAVDVEQLHERLAPYLADHPGTPIGAPTLQPPISAARRREVSVPRDPTQDPRDVTCAALNWLWGDTAEIDAALDAELLDRLLTGHAGAPLTLGLDSSGLGRSSSGTGYIDFLRNGIYSAELKGMDEKDYDRFEPLVFELLESVAHNGFSQADVTAAMHQVELDRRSIGGDSLPFGLQLCLRCIKAWNHDADPVESLDQDAAIARARERVADPDHLCTLLRRNLLDNQSRLLLLARADNDFNDRMAQRLDALRDERLAQTDTAERARLRENALALLARQQASEDASILPDLDLNDVPAEREWARAEDHAGVAVFSQRTNGILHSLALLQLPPLAEADLRILPTLSACIGRLGVGADDYRSWSAMLNATCAGLGASHSFSCGPTDASVRGTLSFEVEGLADRRDDFLGHLPRALAEQRFDEEPRFKELISQALNGMQQR
ncbi:MAG: insulinase family protein, partial [Planctomycetota bacterium]